MKAEVYLLQHSYEIDNGCDETKILGIFSSQQTAEEAIEGYKKLPGFRNKQENFFIDKYELDKKHWAEGFGIN